MGFNYNHEKNESLISSRGIGFEEIIDAIAAGGIIKITAHHNPIKYPNQKILFVRILDDVFAVPFVIESNGDYFLKTLYQSRKAKKSLLN